jgi:Sugar-transfer associated ATP-grasp
MLHTETHAKPFAVKYAFCPIHDFFRPWWKPIRSTDRVHQLYTRAYTSCTITGRKLGWRKAWWRRIKVLVKSIVWPLFCIVAAIRTTLRYGAGARERCGKGRARQFIEQVALGLGEGVPPRSYYLFAMFEEKNGRRASQFVHYHENNYLSAPFVSAGDRQILDDKVRFHEFCRDLALATPSILACFGAGKEDRVVKLPPLDLIVKPVGGVAGGRIERWERGANGAWSGPGGLILNEDALRGYLRELSRNQPFLVQPRAHNHSALRDLSTGGLCTARLVTARAPGELPQLVAAMLRMPVGGSVVDNFSAGGIACTIDTQTGVLTGSAVTWAPLSPRHATHPETGGRIEGVSLPDWDAAVHICLRAQNELRTCPGIGWDMGFTPQGPILLEANLPFGIELTQFVTGAPLLATGFHDALLGFDAQWNRPGQHWRRKSRLAASDRD